MEMLLLFMLMTWVLGWALYSVVGIAGVSAGLSLASLISISWFAVGLLAVYGLIRLAVWVWKRNSYEPGDHVVYLMQKSSTRPGRRAEQVYAAHLGEGYRYFVRKLWTVVDVPAEDRLEVVTPGGKRREVRIDDPRLHKPSPLETIYLALRWKKRFP